MDMVLGINRAQEAYAVWTPLPESYDLNPDNRHAEPDDPVSEPGIDSSASTAGDIGYKQCPFIAEVVDPGQDTSLRADDRRNAVNRGSYDGIIGFGCPMNAVL